MNILPKKNKDLLRTGLRRRFIIALSFFVSIAFFIGIIALMPTYFMIMTNYGDHNGNLSKSEGELLGEEALNSEILKAPIEIESKIQVMQLHGQNDSFLSYLREIFLFLPDSGLIINSLSFNRDKVYKDNQGVWVMISGFSSNRDLLVKFVNDLRSSGAFSMVEVPVTDLTREHNLNFSMNLVFRK